MKKTSLQVYLSDLAKRNVRIFAATHDMTMSEAIEILFTKRLDDLPSPLPCTELSSPSEA